MNLKRMSLSLAIALTLGASTSYTLAADKAEEATNTITATTQTTETTNASANAKAKTDTAVTKTESTQTNTTATTQNPEATKVDTVAKDNATPADIPNTTSTTSGDYTDINKHWAKDEIIAMSHMGYIKGYSDNTFRPNATVTREQIASIYNNIITKKASEKELATIKAKAAKVSYEDVSTDRWSHEAITNLAAAGVMYGAKAGAFVPEHKMTRGEFAVTAALFAKQQGVKNKNASTKVNFKDADTIPASIRPHVEQLAQEGFIVSGATVPFRSNDAITRAEAISILYRIVENKPAKIAKSVAAAEKQAQEKAAAKEEAATKSTPDQTKLEDKVFEELDKTYQNSSRFLDYGVMYWQNDKLHVALKNKKDLETVKANLAARGDSNINDTVVVEQSKYSQAEYDLIEKNFRKQYKTAEPNGTIYTVFPDVPNNQLVTVVSTASEKTQAVLKKAFGTKVKTLIK